jgi:hypothetical protein
MAVRVQKLCALSIQRLKRTATETPSDTHAIDAALLLRLSDHATWGGQHSSSSPDVKLLSSFVRDGLMQVRMWCKDYTDRDTHTHTHTHTHTYTHTHTHTTQILSSYILTTKDESGPSSDSASKMKEQLQLLLCGLAARALGVGASPIQNAHRQFVLDVMTKTLLSR